MLGLPIRLKSKKEIEILSQGGKILSRILQELKKAARPGVSTFFLNEVTEKLIAKAGAESVFKSYKAPWAVMPFGFAICTSLNEVVVHGKPSAKTILKDGDVLSLDMGIRYKGLITDSAITFVLGRGNKTAKNLLKTTEKSLYAGIQQAKIDNKISDISKVIENVVRSEGFSPVKQLVGHGVGFSLHEPPEILNYYDPKHHDYVIEEGLVLAIEPMVSEGSGEIAQYQDESFATKEKCLSAHFEHTIAVTKSGPKILTR